MLLTELFDNIGIGLLLEGGNIWPESSHYDQAIASQLVAITNNYLKDIGAKSYVIGSAATPTPGKMSGDLDVLVDLNQLEKVFNSQDPKIVRQKLEQYLQQKGLKTKKSGVTVHILLPFKGHFYQVDIKTVRNAERIRLFHTHSLPKNSPFKGLHKHLLMNSLATSQGMLWSGDEGLYARDAAGKKSKFLTDDLDKIAQYLIGPHAKGSDLGSVESILAAMPDSKRKQEMIDLSVSSGRWGEVKPVVEAVAPKTGRKYQHIEDLVFTNGSVGGLHAVERLKEMSTEGKGIELKWDGSPVIYWGRDEKGKFHMLPKNAMEYLKRGAQTTKEGVKTFLSSPADVAKFISNTGDTENKERQVYAQNLSQLWPYFEKISPKKGYIEGGLLFWPGDPATKNIKTNEWDFKPNVTGFHVPIDSELGQKISKAKVMIAATGYYAYIGADERRYPDAAKLSSSDVIVQGTTYVESIPQVNTKGLDRVLAFIQKNAEAIDTFVSGQPGLSKPGDILYKFFNQNLRVEQVTKRFAEWVNKNLGIEKAQKILSNPGLKAVLSAVEMITAEKYKLLDALSQGVNGGIRQTHPEGYVQAHSGKKYQYDLPGQFIKAIDQKNWNPKMKADRLQEDLQRTGKSKSAVVGWGRGMGHKGHMFLASSVLTQAKKSNADPYFVVSRTVGKDDPITPEEKLAIYRKVFPQQAKIFFAATDEMPDLTQVLRKLQDLGYTQVTVVVGEDQVKALSYVKRYNGVPNRNGEIQFTFDKLDVISRQETGDPSSSEAGPRATPMREILKDPKATPKQKFQVWRDAMSPEISDKKVLTLMKKAQQRLTESPDFGYSKFNDRDKDFKNISWSTQKTDKGFIIRAIYNNGKKAFIGKISCVKFKDGIKVSMIIIQDPTWVGTGLGQLMYDKAVEQTKIEGYRRFWSDSQQSINALNAWEKRLKNRYNVKFDGKENKYYIDLTESIQLNEEETFAQDGWFDSAGTYIGCGYAGHLELLQDHRIYSYIDAYNKGWIHYYNLGGGKAELETSLTLKKSKSYLYRVCRKIQKYFPIINIYIQGFTYEWDGDDIVKKKRMLMRTESQEITELRLSKEAKEAKIAEYIKLHGTKKGPISGYGWLLPDKTYIHNTRSHLDTAEKLGYNDYDDAFKAGLIRIWKSQYNYYLETDRTLTDRKTEAAILNGVKRMSDASEIFVYVGSGTGNYQRFKWTGREFKRSPFQY